MNIVLAFQLSKKYKVNIRRKAWSKDILYQVIHNIKEKPEELTYADILADDWEIPKSQHHLCKDIKKYLTFKK